MGATKQMQLEEAERERAQCGECKKARKSTCDGCGDPICRPCEGRRCQSCGDHG